MSYGLILNCLEGGYIGVRTPLKGLYGDYIGEYCSAFIGVIKRDDWSLDKS